ncbi:MAG: T9SS type B sorting domain-containing protein [Flavobacteriaceae bacterium]
MKLNILICLIFTSILGYSQAEASHWYFGNGAGLIFDVSTGTVTSTDAASNTISTNEGCSSISDFNGNLLLYTDGRNVWDKNHNIMSNADYNAGTGLMGDPSSTSSGLIVPKPGNPNQYYIFTVDEPHHQNAFAFPSQGPAEADGSSTNEYDSGGGVPDADDGFNNGFAYSLVDLTLNNGNGNVVSAEKNIQLVTYNPNEQGQESYKCSEKITAVEHSDKQSYWVLTQFIDNFYAFRVDATGVNTTPVVTNIIPLINFEGYRRNAIGYMKASPDGSRIAVCHRQNGDQPGGFSNNTGSVWIYDFDNTTGVLSNPINLLPNFGPYSVEFSPNSSKLYVSGSNSVTQFDLNTSDPASTDFVVYSGFNFIGALQLGPDGKVYVANSEDSQSLDVINDPNTYGIDADYVPYQVQLAPGTFSNIGLPPFIQSFFLASIQLENSCVGQDVNFSVNSTQVFDSIAWDFGDGLGTANENNPSYIFSTPGTYTVSAEITAGTEVITFTEDIIISQNPTAFPTDDLLICDDNNDGVSSFTFQESGSDIINGQDTAVYSISYHLSLADAENNANAINLPYQNTNSTEEIFVRIENNNNSNCFDTTSFNLTVFDTPTANAVQTVEECDNLDDGNNANGQREIDLNNFDDAILGAQDNTLFSVSYHLTQGDANNNDNPISSPYYNTTPFSYQIFARIENNLKTECYDTTEFTVNISATPTANDAEDIFECDDNDDGVLFFDFADAQTQVLNNQNAANFSITFHSSLADAENNANAINLPYQNTNSTEEIFVRIENNNNSNCFDTTSFNLTVFDTPTANAVQTVEECDNLDDGNNANGQREIDLNNFDDAILGAQDNTLFSVSYHLTQGDANNNDNPISSPYYNTTPFSYQIFARIENNLKTECYDTTVFTVNINPIPVAFDTTLIQCDEDGVNDGFTIFNLDEANSAVTNGVSGLSTKFFLLESDAQNSTGEINAAPFTNTANPQIIYVQVINDNTGCFDISQISLEVSLTSGNNSELKSCDDDGIEDGFKSFTLSDATPSILAGLPSDYNLAYYETYENALLEQNPLSNTFTNTIAFNQIIYARIENNNQCYGINELELTVFKLPQLEEDDQTFFCIDSNSDPVILNSGVIGNPSDYSYVWSSGETTEDIEISQGGTYTVTVTNTNNCSQSKSITVVNSNIATIETIDINDVSSNNTISIVATGEGDYEYALDNINGPYQDDTTFYDVSPGFHTVYVRDKNGCGIANETVSVIGFPNFFTPNGDGYNDTWHIYGINTPSQSESKIYIFDRYGKLLKQLLYDSLGWDGTYNGNPMPTSDYWFYIKLGDNRIFRGHFTLKR